MSRGEFTPNHPPRLTADLVKKITNAGLLVAKGAGDAPVSPLDWIASTGGVRKPTIQKWMKTANGVARSGATGPKAQRWIKYRNGVDALISACAYRVAGKLGDLAWKGATEKIQLDALTAVQKRLDRHELQLEATDVEIEADDSVAQISQGLLDALSDAQREALDAAQLAMAQAAATLDQILVEAAGQIED